MPGPVVALECACLLSLSRLDGNLCVPQDGTDTFGWCGRGVRNRGRGGIRGEGGHIAGRPSTTLVKASRLCWIQFGNMYPNSSGGISSRPWLGWPVMWWWCSGGGDSSQGGKGPAALKPAKYKAQSLFVACSKALHSGFASVVQQAGRCSSSGSAARSWSPLLAPSKGQSHSPLSCHHAF
jgi:hypothetical protein